jgi:uncharacterized phage infection (PIP) family protein YhgE
MDNSQTSGMVSWLDEERRKDKAIITRLEERTTAQDALIQDQARRIRELEEELGKVRQAGVTADTLDEIIDRLRNEFQVTTEQAITRRQQLEQEALREISRETVAKTIEDLHKEIRLRLERELDTYQAEQDRLARVATELQEFSKELQSGNIELAIATLEEQRRMDAKRLSELNASAIELTKRLDSAGAKSELLEGLSRRNERALEELGTAITELNQQQAERAEQSVAVKQQQERLLAEMNRRIDAFATEMEGYGQRFETWTDTYRTMKRVTDDYERESDRLERRLNEASEAQRLSEERFRSEWEELNRDNQRRWQQFTLTAEEIQRENERHIGQITSSVTEMREQIDRHDVLLKALVESNRELFQVLTERIQAMVDRIAQLGD